MSDVTRLLDEAAAGDRKAAPGLLPLVYDERGKLAAARMAAERPDHTLDAKALVHEAYLRLVGDQRFDHRGHFFAAPTRMRSDHPRRRRVCSFPPITWGSNPPKTGFACGRPLDGLAP